MARYVRRALIVFSAAVAVMIAAHVGASMLARHEITQNESAVAIHSAGLAAGQGIYHRLGSYPYTISPYMPSFYTLQAALHVLRLPILKAGRLLSILALVGLILVSWRILRLLTGEPYAAWAGTLIIAATANLTFWGTVGQVDVLGVVFSLTALYHYFRYRSKLQTSHIIWAGVFVLLAVFTKQTMLASGFTIFFSLAADNRRRAAWFALSLVAIASALALLLNQFTGGGFFDNTLFANINPFSRAKLWQHLQYFGPVAAGPLVIVLAGLRRTVRTGIHPLLVYLGASAVILFTTGWKIGSDLNYQLETMVALGLCAGWSLHCLSFFPLCFQSSRSPVTLLQAPLAVYVVLNLVISAKVLAVRAAQESLRRQEYAELQPYLESEGHRVISVQFDPLLQSGRGLEVEPLIYTLMVRAGRIDPGQVQQDLADGRFSLVILFEDLSRPRDAERDLELPSLPSEDLEIIRQNYRLVRHIPGSLLGGDYLYAPAGADRR